LQIERKSSGCNSPYFLREVEMSTTCRDYGRKDPNPSISPIHFSSLLWAKTQLAVDFAHSLLYHFLGESSPGHLFRP